MNYQVYLGAYMSLHGTIKLTVQCIKCQTKVFSCYSIIKGILVGPEIIRFVLQNVARSGERLGADSVRQCHGRLGGEMGGCPGDSDAFQMSRQGPGIVIPSISTYFHLKPKSRCG